ncbi:MAG TPA: hypothetical protein VGB09_10270 [Candidatus Binatia bacterium]
MSSILVVQPSKMLQQAFVFALAAEHQIRVTEKTPELEAARDIDLAIVDTAALRAGDLAAEPELSAIRSWQIPIIWVGGEAPAAESAAHKWVRLLPPLDRESLKKAIADCLGSSPAPSQQFTPNPPGAPALKENQSKEAQPQSVGADTKADKIDVIDLVEVVEEQPARDVTSAEARKKS